MIEAAKALFAFDEKTTPEQCRSKLIVGLRAMLEVMEREALLRNENLFLKWTIFGKSSEKKAKPPEPDPKVFDEAKATREDLANDEAMTETTTAETIAADEKLDAATNPIDVKNLEKKKKPKGRKPIPPLYQRIDVIHDLDEDKKVCTCGCALTMFGEAVSEQVQNIPAQIVVLRHKRLKYGCENCQTGVSNSR